MPEELSDHDILETEPAITHILEEDGTTAPSPTESGGPIGASMAGGGTIGNPETTDDKQGNPSGPGPSTLQAPSEDINTDRFQRSK